MTARRGAKRVRTRAVSESSKLERKTSLRTAAQRLFATRDYNRITMDDVAREAGLAKGTVYLYFETKEALFLDLVSSGMAAWFEELSGDMQKVSTPAATAALIAETLARRPDFVRLLALLHTVLEQNIDSQSLAEFKRGMLALVAIPGKLLEESFALFPGTGVRVAMWIHSVVVGIAQVTTPCPALAQVLEQDSTLAPFRLDFRTELEAALTSLLNGLP